MLTDASFWAFWCCLILFLIVLGVRDLIAGQAQTSTATMWAWEYWAFNVPTGNTNTLLIKVDQVGDQEDADCDVYIKQGSLPSHTNYDFRDVSLDGHVEQNISNPRGRYYVGVFAFRECAYSIKASLGNACPANCNGRGVCNALGVCECTGAWTGRDCSQQIPTLALGTQVSGAVQLREWKTYRLNLPYTYSALTFTLQQTGATQNTADLDLYVRRGLAPTLLNFDYANGSMHHTTTVSVADAAAGDWYVGVWGYACTSTQGCTFTIQASITDRCPNRCSMRGFCRGTACSCTPGFSGDYCETMNSNMQLGSPYTGYVESFSWNYYTFRAFSSNPVRITVNPGAIHDGDCDIYVRRDSRPTIFQYDFKDNSLDTNGTVDIQSPGESTWHIGMYGYRRCDYTISIAAITDTGRCQNGGHSTGGTCICPAGWGGDLCTIRVQNLLPSPQEATGSVRSGEFVYYNLSLSYTPSDLVVYVKETTQNSKGNVWLFLNQEFVPTIREHAFEDVDTNTAYHMIKISREQLPQRRAGAQHFIIGVYGSPYLVSNTAAAYRLSAWASPFQ
jgi:hypothetical protein